jgi:hypothetical protein
MDLKTSDTLKGLGLMSLRTELEDLQKATLRHPSFNKTRLD